MQRKLIIEGFLLREVYDIIQIDFFRVKLFDLFYVHISIK